MPRTGDIYNLPAGGAVAGTEAKSNDVLTPLADLAAEQNLVRPISAGGTGASTTSAARAALGFGSMAPQNADNVAITGGSIDNVAITGGSIDNVTMDGGTF